MHDNRRQHYKKHRIKSRMITKPYFYGRDIRKKGIALFVDTSKSINPYL
jgi:hypothetical protein